MRRLLCFLSLCFLLLVGCSSTSAGALNARDVHTRWVAAVRANDRATVLALVKHDLPQREQFVDQALGAIADLQTAPHSPTGALRDVEIRDPIPQGAVQEAMSVWYFERKTWCYRTALMSTDDGWRVIGWGQVAQCP